MRKILATLALVLLTWSVSYGAASDDVYVRKDVFDAKMEAFMSEMRGEFQVMNTKIEALSVRMDEKFQSLETRINERFRGVDDKIQSLDTRISDLRNGIYLWLVAIGLVVSWPKLREIFRSMSSSSPSITLEDVKRLIEENNVKLRNSLQG